MTVKYSKTNTDTPKVQIELKSGPLWNKKETTNGSSKSETHLALTMMGLVLVFLVCHSPRVMLNIYEMTYIR